MVSGYLGASKVSPRCSKEDISMTQGSWRILFQWLEGVQKAAKALQLPREPVRCTQWVSQTKPQEDGMPHTPSPASHLDFTGTDVICKQLTYLSSPVKQTQNSSGRCFSTFLMYLKEKHLCTQQNFTLLWQQCSIIKIVAWSIFNIFSNFLQRDTTVVFRKWFRNKCHQPQKCEC